MNILLLPLTVLTQVIQVVGLPILAIISIVLFIKDRRASKKEGRSVNKLYMVMFIISIAIIGLFIMLGVLLVGISISGVKGM